MTAPSYHVHVLPDAVGLKIGAHQTLLEALLGAGLAWPRLCRTGTCRECRAQVRSGQVRYTVDWPGLSADERRAGHVLPCVALAESDLIIER